VASFTLIKKTQVVIGIPHLDCFVSFQESCDSWLWIGGETRSGPSYFHPMPVFMDFCVMKFVCVFRFATFNAANHKQGLWDLHLYCIPYPESPSGFSHATGLSSPYFYYTPVFFCSSWTICAYFEWESRRPTMRFVSLTAWSCSLGCCMQTCRTKVRIAYTKGLGRKEKKRMTTQAAKHSIKEKETRWPEVPWVSPTKDLKKIAYTEGLD